MFYHYTGVLVLGEEDHRDEVHSSHIISRVHAVNVTSTVDFTVVMWLRFPAVQVNSFCPLSIQNFLEGSHYVPPMLKGLEGQT